MATPSTIIIRALQMIGEKAIGGTLSTDEQTAYLSALNGMLETWSIERLTCYAIRQESVALTASTASYTMGTSSGTFSTTRPNRIEKAFVRDTSNFDSELQVIGFDAYDSIVDKNGARGCPRYLFNDCQFTGTGQATISVYPSPTAGYTLYVDSWQTIQNFPSISTTVYLPPGYQRAIESNLAIELAPGLISVMPEVVRIAKESKTAIKSLNMRDLVLSLDPGIAPARGGNIFQG